MTLPPVEETLDTLRQGRDSERATQMAAYHKQTREVLGVSNEVLNTLARDLRQTCDLEARVELAAQLWASGIFEARILAAKLLTQARIKPDTAPWELLVSWVPEFDSWAIADHAASALGKRLQAAPDRLDLVETWTTAEHMWTRRAAMVATLPWAKMANPKPAELEARDRILGWAGRYVADRAWFIQKSIGWWLRDLSKHDPDRTRAFLDAHGAQMKGFARKEAAKHLKD